MDGHITVSQRFWWRIVSVGGWLAAMSIGVYFGQRIIERIDKTDERVRNMQMEFSEFKGLYKYQENEKKYRTTTSENR